jgi:NADH dehydrogenase
MPTDNPSSADAKHRVVIIGGGFGGLAAARAFKGAPVEVTLVDRRNFHLFQPLLYQVAAGGLSPANIAMPLRSILKRQRNSEVLLGEVTSLDVQRKRVILADGEIPYDTLIIAAGARHHYFGNDQWESLAPGLKTIEDATEIRRRIFSAFEAAERGADPEAVAHWLTFVIVGAGPTGVELAGAIGELSRHTLKNEFRHIDSARANVLLVEGLDRVLPTFPPDLSAKAAASLARLGVTVRTGTRVTSIDRESLTLKAGGEEEVIGTRTVFWAAGVMASPLGKAVAQATGAELDRAGRVLVEPDCSVKGFPELFVIGDLACHRHGFDKPLPGVAPVATQQGIYVAQLVGRRLRGFSMPPFKYTDRGNMATIGRAAAVAQLGTLHFSGFLAWLTWLFVHLLFLIGFQNRMLVMMQWGWSYFSRNRAARLITEGPFSLPSETQSNAEGFKEK